MQLKLLNIKADSTATITIADEVFATGFNEPLVHQVVTAWMAGARAGTRAQKNRAAVRGGGHKPWRQKGTGRARAGSSNSPIWRGGGVTFAATPKDYSQKVNRKMYRAAMRSILSELIRQERLFCVEDFSFARPATRLATQALSHLGVKEALIVADDPEINLYLATRNLPGVAVVDSTEINPCWLVASNTTVFTRLALEKVEARLR